MCFLSISTKTFFCPRNQPTRTISRSHIRSQFPPACDSFYAFNIHVFVLKKITAPLASHSFTHSHYHSFAVIARCFFCRDRKTVFLSWKPATSYYLALSPSKTVFALVYLFLWIQYTYFCPEKNRTLSASHDLINKPSRRHGRLFLVDT